MFKGVRDHIRRHVVGYIALFFALTATAQALPGHDSVFSDDIKNGEVKSPDVGAQQIQTQDLGQGAVTRTNVAPDAIGPANLTFDPATQPELNGLATSDGNPPNAGSNRVHWNNLTGVPPGFVDGFDNAGGIDTITSARVDGFPDTPSGCCDTVRYARIDGITDFGTEPNFSAASQFWTGAPNADLFVQDEFASVSAPPGLGNWVDVHFLIYRFDGTLRGEYGCRIDGGASTCSTGPNDAGVHVPPGALMALKIQAHRSGLSTVPAETVLAGFRLRFD